MNALNECFCRCDVAEAMEEMQATGVAFVPAMLKEDFRKRLADEVEKLSFKRATEVVGVVRQAFDYCAFLGTVPDNPCLETIRCATQELVRRAGEKLADPGLMNWFGREVAVNRYGRDGGLGAHRDLKRHPDVLAIWNVCGSCDFEMLSDREGHVLKSFQPHPGDLVLLRGMGSPDRRPFHRVSNVIGEGPRISVTVRHDTDPDNLIAGFTYANT